jgi:hypothetical protein
VNIVTYGSGEVLRNIFGVVQKQVILGNNKGRGILPLGAAQRCLKSDC